MPVQTVEELRALKAQIQKLYGVYGERIIAAEPVSIYRIESTKRPAIKSATAVSGAPSDATDSAAEAPSAPAQGGIAEPAVVVTSSPSVARLRSSENRRSGTFAKLKLTRSRSKPVDRLLVVGKHRVYIFQLSGSLLGSSTLVLKKDFHLYDMAQLTCSDNTTASLVCKAAKDAVEIRIKSSRVPELVAAIRASYAAITVGYHPEMLAAITVAPECLLPLDPYMQGTYRVCHKHRHTVRSTPAHSHSLALTHRADSRW